MEPTFNGLGIAPALLDILARANFKTPTPIQIQAIPQALEDKDVVGIAQTGTGKTLAFAIPILQRLQRAKGRALIVAPTRELALQIEEMVQKIGRPFGVRTVVIMGGASMGMQIQKLRQNPRVIIATPGRLLDHLEQRTLRLTDIQIVVMDEADRMFDMGFMPAIKKIFAALPPQSARQTMLFSATMPPN
ncbi:MAG: DEAD/DEAH box helicase, ATP-dependent RNA helicase RhlE [Candidatus Magasanikbacteria bacterium]|nr:DEAD/DEAH box helicase, ATP-dependent RNA helicase RhlE [Candidatus Magasanikbacteria bacterium]